MIVFWTTFDYIPHKMFYKVVLLLLITVPIPYCASQFIFEKTSFCDFEIKGKKLEIVSNLTIINVKSKQLAIAISPCKHFSRIPNVWKNNARFRNCDRNSRGCILEGKTVRNAGSKFIYNEIDLEESNKKERVLTSVDGEQCGNGDNYKIVIHFDCEGVIPSYNDNVDEEYGGHSDPCTFNVRMLAPYCTLRCMTNVNGNIVNLKQLATMEDVIVPVLDEPGRRAVLSICRSTEKCSATNDTLACEVEAEVATNTGISTVTAQWGNADNERVLWDNDNQQIFFRSRIGIKKERRTTEIRLLCNWDIEHFQNARMIKNSKNTKSFEIESQYGCIKTAQNCKASSFKSGIFYNLENLYKTDNWLLTNTSSNKINLNICGNLKIPQNEVCHKSHAQVCDLTRNINYGSIYKPIQVEQHEQYLTTSTTGGSMCKKDPSKLYSTNIKFICKFGNSGPRLFKETDCSLDVIWETEEACPKYISKGENCKASYFESSGLIDLNQLHTSSDRFISLSPSMKLRYNLCGNLATACDNITEASLCLISKNERETVLGRTNNQISIINGAINSYFYNSYDFDVDRPNVNVSYICNHNQPIEGSIQINTIQDKVTYQMTVETPLACTTTNTHPCTFSHTNGLYDLTALMRNDSNYVVSSGSNTFHINVCRPVINNDRSLCRSKTMACLNNGTEPNLISKYLSLGTQQEINFDKSLYIKYKFGALCLHSRSSYMEATILFTCSTNEESGPLLVESTNCNHTFTWRTKHACPKKFAVTKRSHKECVIRIAEKIIYNFTTLRKNSIDLDLPNDASIYLNICNGEYELHDNGNISNSVATQKVVGKEVISLEYNLFDNHTIVVNIYCEPDMAKEAFETDVDYFKTWIENRRIDVRLKTFLACEEKVAEIPTVNKTDTVSLLSEKSPELTVAKDVNREIGSPVIEVIPVVKSNEAINVPELKSSQSVLNNKDDGSKDVTKDNCYLTSMYDTVLLNSFPPITVKSDKNSYYIDFNNSLNCKTYICKNNLSLDVMAVHDNCPKFAIEENVAVVKFELLNSSMCKDRKSGLRLNMNCGQDIISKLDQESDCLSIISYQNPSLCGLSNTMPLMSNTASNNKNTLAIIIPVSILMVILLVLSVILYRRQKRRLSSRLIPSTEFISLYKED